MECFLSVSADRFPRLRLSYSFFVRIDWRKIRIYMRVNSGHLTREEGEKEWQN